MSLMMAVSVAGVDADGMNKADLARLEGVWSFDYVEVDGEKRPQPPFETNKVIIQKTGRFVIVQGSTITHGVMTVDTSKTPKQYDSTITSGVAKGLKFPCIYEVTDDTYKLCGPYRGGNRPIEFKTGSGSGLVMQILKRQKQGVSDALIEAARKDLAGAWIATSCIHDGKPMPEEDAKKLTFSWDADGKITGHGADGAPVAASTKIDATNEPMTLDVSYTEGQMTGQSVLGLAAIDGNTLTICYAAPGKPRPTDLKSDPGSGQTLATYNRETTEKK